MSDFEHIELDILWKNVLEKMSTSFGDIEDLQDVVFLIGVQKLGLGYQKFSKEEKVDVMHIGICTILEPYGYYQYQGTDKDGWPHFATISQLPPMNEKDREILLKKAIIEYFEER